MASAPPQACPSASAAVQAALAGAEELLLAMEQSRLVALGTDAPPEPVLLRMRALRGALDAAAPPLLEANAAGVGADVGMGGMDGALPAGAAVQLAPAACVAPVGAAETGVLAVTARLGPRLAETVDVAALGGAAPEPALSAEALVATLNGFDRSLDDAGYAAAVRQVLAARAAPY